MSHFPILIWLVAVREVTPPDEIRRFWNAKEDTPNLDAFIERSPSILLGTTEVTVPENVGLRGPVGRVFDLLVLRGTTPEYVLPLIDDTLTADLLACLEPDPADPAFDVLPAADLATFLSAHAGEHLATRDQPVSQG